MNEAKARVGAGAIWLDVRLPSEYKFDHLKEAVNIPLNQLRSSMADLNVEHEYVIYCQTGRRSLAAAFILIQNGFNASVLKGGTRG